MIHGTQNYYRRAETPEQIERIEIMQGIMFLSVLLVIMAIGNFAACFFHLPLMRKTSNSIWDSLILLLLAVAFATVTRINIRNHLVTPFVTLLSCIALVFITVRFYSLMGPAIWTLYFIFLLLALMSVSGMMLFFVSITIFLCHITLILLQYSRDPFFELSTHYIVIQDIHLVILGIIAIVYHKTNANRDLTIFSKTREYMEKLESMAVRDSLQDNKRKGNHEFGELSKVYEQLVMQEKLAGIGRLAAGAAHEINNSLGYIICNMEITRQYFQCYREIVEAYQDLINSLSDNEVERHRSRIEGIRALEKKNGLSLIASDIWDLSSDMAEGLDGIKDIVAGLKAFSGVGKDGRIEEYDLNKGIKKALMAVKSEIKYQMTIIEQLVDIPVIEACGGEINQVLLNLILNATDAVRAKKFNDDGWVKVTTVHVGDVVIFEIEDNGIGIEPAPLERIFEPFFTTKSPDKGTGLGLSIAYDIVVHRHFGEIAVSSKPDVGTKFSVKLPVRHPIVRTKDPRAPTEG